MRAVPAATPTTIPVLVPTVPTDELLLLQTPPPVASVSAVADEAQMVIVPVIAAGVGRTVKLVSA